MSTAQPAFTPLTPRATEIVSAARVLLEERGEEALTMREIAASLGIRAASLYKHFPDKAAVEAALIEQGFAELGAALYTALEDPDPVAALLRAYRSNALAAPHLYRLATGRPLARDRLAPGLEEWSGTPFFLAVGDPHRAQALWAFTHGMVILELDGRFPPDSDLDRTWAEGARSFSPAPSTATETK